ncbi:Nicotinate-nucleotide-dimethylbenzimidazolephosp horibosyltransferase [Halothece sp. PCC 7418]|uniref:nicotinate mononucleotide-dependent phosphoribosyltransferase CobT n=1 Tax=Halothece sp. (strain PCC 7418) TaxID=65093 RepID=UPI0002A063EC|nr:TIGR00303 family protein [Halothece sp. PCC 7418]AFZ44575.1 Nicotinate-nucleotide-dimethylbenzimidazolephosp horibosyltransferase [Halothece sp. PCC 7418]
MIPIYTQIQQGNRWLNQYRGKRPALACVLGFTETGLLPEISAAGATPDDRRYTAIADGECLVNGIQPHPKHPLPPLTVGASPTLISRAFVEALDLPVYLFNAGLPKPPAVPHIDLGGIPAQCVSTGQALPRSKVEALFAQGWQWGEVLAKTVKDSYLIIGECVVGGTTTALGLLTGLRIAAANKVNSSHPHCNHRQKWEIVQAGLGRTDWYFQQTPVDPFGVVAAVGDPMQAVVAGMALSASREVGVLLAGGTQMLAIYALMQRLLREGSRGKLEQVAVGTTRWVTEDLTGDTVGLANTLEDVPLLATGLSFAESRYPQLNAYEDGYVKEGVAAGGCAIAAHLYLGWNQAQLLHTIESLVEQYAEIGSNADHF